MRAAFAAQEVHAETGLGAEVAFVHYGDCTCTVFVWPSGEFPTAIFRGLAINSIAQYHVSVDAGQTNIGLLTDRAPDRLSKLRAGISPASPQFFPSQDDLQSCEGRQSIVRDLLFAVAVVLLLCVFLWAEAATVRADSRDPSEAILEEAGGGFVREHASTLGSGFFGEVADDGDAPTRDQSTGPRAGPCADARTCAFSVFDRNVH